MTAPSAVNMFQPHPTGGPDVLVLHTYTTVTGDVGAPLFSVSPVPADPGDGLTGGPQ